MGIAFAVGAIVGAQAIQQLIVLIVLVASLALVAAAITSTPRTILVVLVTGTVTGSIAGHIQAPSVIPPLGAAPRTVVAHVATDPKIERSGASSWVGWRDPNGIDRRSFARFPASPLVGRGDIIEAAVTVEGVYGELLIVTRHRVLDTPAGPELIRRTIRSRLSSIASNRVSGSPGTLTLGLLIGDDSALPIDERAALRRSGLSHITAVSGWNVTLVTGSIGAVFLAFRLRGWFWILLQLSLMGAYVWIVGLEPPVTRAAIMAIVALAATRLGRPSHSITAMSLAAALMVMLSPQIVESLSFQLSVLATFALIAAMRMSEQLAGWKKALVTPALASSMTGLATAPVLAATLGTLSLATVPANIVAGPLVPIAAVGGLLTAAAEPVPLIATALGWIVWLLCALILLVAAVGSSIPFGFFEFAPLQGPAAAVAHLLVFAIVASVTPEGRLLRHRIGNWARDEPRAAAATGAGMATTLLTAVIVV